MSTAGYALEHFYYGQPLANGQPQGDLQLLASSAGVTQEHVREAMQIGRVPPLAGHPDGSWALLRGRSQPFLLVQAQRNAAGQGMRHVIFVPVDVLRLLSGNIKALAALVETDMPTLPEPGTAVDLLVMPSGSAPATEDQEDALLALMNATRDRFDVIEGLLAALIGGKPIVITQAPPQMRERLGLVEGLLALLPPPARFGVTFATHATAATQIDVQIRFMGEDEALPANALHYVWGARDLSGQAPHSEYSRFIKSQLRLDITLVVERTATLAPIAAWRIKQGDALSEALGYASRRLRVDDALSNNQPVDAPEVAKILTNDTTLSDDLRAIYVQHLLAFALALDEMEHADLLAVVVRGQPDMERVIIRQMSAELDRGKAERVYHTLTRWLLNPLGFNGMLWIDLFHRAALEYAEILVQAGDEARLTQLLDQLRENYLELQTNTIFPQLIRISMPLGTRSPELAQMLFVLAASTLPTNRWQQFVNLPHLAAHLSADTQRLLKHLSAFDPSAPPFGLLNHAAASFGETWQPLMLIRLAEVAALATRYDLFDMDSLPALAAAAATDWGARYDQTLRWIVRNFYSDNLLTSLGAKSASYLAQILLARRAYAELTDQLLRQRRLLYAAENKQLAFAAMIRRVFAETPLPVAEVPAALQALEAGGIKPLALILAHTGALESHKWSAALDDVATHLVTLLGQQRMVIEVLRPDVLTDLVKYYVERRDTAAAVRVANLIAVPAARRGESGIAPLVDLYRVLDWDEPSRAAGIDALRYFVRHCSEPVAARGVARFGNDLGPAVREKLEATFVLRRLLGGDLTEHADVLHVAAGLLYDFGSAYVDRSNVPTIQLLVGDLHSLNGGLDDSERVALADEFLELGRSVNALASQHRRAHPRENNQRITGLLGGQGEVSSVLDIFWVMGGYFAQGQRAIPRVERPVEPHPMGGRAAPLLLQDLQAINALFKAALRALVAIERVSLSAATIQQEIESQWGAIDLQARRALVRDLAVDLQRIPEMILISTDKADDKALQDTSSLARRLDKNMQRPENVLDLCRFVYGYFKTRVV
ncbi:MAG: hypothetical protein GYB67_17995 [Chloroflexi bacterium]|nr:hypothetical protein [Chloroflexota bacterium]